MSILDGLNSNQKVAASHINGPLLILAGAGSGKTRTLTYRMAHMVLEKEIPAFNILAVTFTNKAAKEMKERVNKLIGHEANNLTVSTFHSFGVKLLRTYSKHIGYENNFNIYDSDDQVRVIKNVLKELGSPKIDWTPRKIVSKISKLKENGETPEEFDKKGAHYPELKIVAKCYEKYQRFLINNNSMDFSDLLIYTDKLLNNEDVLQKVQNRYHYIMVDEYQDTNNIQYNIIKKIAMKSKNICVVGDEDQSIYGFRGANIQNILDFEKDYKEAKTVKLEQNYRSTSVILDAANSIIKLNKSSKGKKLWTDITGGEKISLLRLENAGDEAYFVTSEIIKNFKTDKDYSKNTILYRTNAQSRLFEDMFIKYNIPYKIFGGMQFYQRKEIKDIIAYLNICNNPSDSLSLERIINVPNRKVGARTIEKLKEYSSENDISLFEALSFVDSLDRVPSTTKISVQKLYNDLKEIIDEVSTNTASEIYDMILDKTKILDSYSKDEESRVENIKELKNSIVELEEQDGYIELGEYLEKTSLSSATDSLEDSNSYVKLMTIHNSKGLEFDTVFLVGFEQDIFPGYGAFEDEDILEEERRLCYVAVTRAEKKLYLTYAEERTVFGQTSYNRQPTMFLQDIPTELIDSNIKERKKDVYVKKSNETVNPLKVGTKKDLPYNVGEKVVHKKFGTGMIKAIEQSKRLVIKFLEGEKKIPLAVAEKFIEKVD